MSPPNTPIGILLANLGTPDAPTPGALRRYLGEFLWDRRVVEMPRALWWLILNGIILNVRPRKSAKLYAKVWTAEGSPLLAIGRRQTAALGLEIERRGMRAHVVLGMRYGSPSIRTALEELRARNCWQVLVLPLYPQYFAGTTGSTFDAVATTVMAWRRVPELRFVADYHDDDAYITALARSVRAVWGRDGEPERLLLSFHGIPQRYAAAGDPYAEQCQRTAELLRAQLGLDANRVVTSFQSRFGREAWLQPYTDTTLQEWAGAGVRRVDVLCPGFAADCLETLEEIDQLNRALFLKAGGAQFRYLPALNDAPEHIAALAGLVQRQTSGWLR
jgi:ferrochelatase